jgi:glycosyltransferase involved in cell wall biosynthesis
MAELGYRIHLICFSERNLSQADSEMVMASLGAATLRIHQWSILYRHPFLRRCLSILKSIFRSNIPLTAMHFTSSEIVRFVKGALLSRSPKFVLWDGLHPMGALFRKELSQLKECINIYRAHNCETMIWAGYARSKSSPLTQLLRYQVERMQRFESICLREASAVAFVQESDLQCISQENQKKQVAAVVPISLPESPDTTPLQVKRWRRVNVSDTEVPDLQLLWLGGLNWWPNREGLEWFARSVWSPLCSLRPNVSLTLVGRGTEKICFRSQDRVRALGFVEDIESIFAEADLLVVPILSGSGVRVKALEALSQAVPCIGTPLGLSGVPPSGVFVAEESSEWIHVLRVLSNRECFIQGMHGARAVRQLNSRKLCALRMDELLHRADH